MREDYSPDGDAWRALPHEEARSRAYRWGEDGLAGICDERGSLCLALALWNGRDRILKERLFGLDQPGGQPRRGRQGSLPLSRRRPEPRLPEDALPLSAGGLSLRRTRPRRSLGAGADDPEYEIEDTGIFDGDRFFDVTVEYAKADADDIHVVITALNRGPETAELHLIPQLWFRNIVVLAAPDRRAPRIALRQRRAAAWSASIRGSGRTASRSTGRRSCCSARTTPTCAAMAAQPDADGPYKDGLHAAIVDGDAAAVARGTRAPSSALHYALRARARRRAAGAPAARGRRVPRPRGRRRRIRGPAPRRGGGRLLRGRFRTGSTIADAARDLPAGRRRPDLVEAALPLRRARAG